MNERERLMRTLTCTGPDRPSLGDYFAFDSTRQRWEREGLPQGLNNDSLFDYFGMDHINIWGRDKLPILDGPLPALAWETIEDTSEYVVRKAGHAVIRALMNEPPPAMPQFLSYEVTDRASWADYKSRLDPDTPGRLPADLQAIGRASSGRTTPLGVWLGGTYGLIRNWMGVENASYLFYDDPALVEEMMEHLTFFYRTLAQRIFAAGVQLDWVMFWEDMAFRNGSLLSPEMYARYCMPFYRTMVDLLHRHGVKVIALDSDGDIHQLIPLWLEAGINVMHPMEVAAGMDVRETRRRYGSQVTFLGGIDKRAVARGREAIDAEVIPKMRELKDSGGGFIVQCDHGIPPDISLDNYRYFRDLVRRLGEQE